jgi:hypothetical protein
MNCLAHIHRPFAIVVLLAALGLGACATPSVQNVPMPDQSKGIQDERMSRVYFLRPGQTYGKVAPVMVFDGETKIGKVGTGSFLCWERPAGRSLVRAVYKPVEPRAANEGLYDLNTEPGGTYYCSVSLKHGTFEPEVVTLSTEEGEQMLRGLGAAEVNIP